MDPTSIYGGGGQQPHIQQRNLQPQQQQQPPLTSQANYNANQQNTQSRLAPSQLRSLLSSQTAAPQPQPQPQSQSLPPSLQRGLSNNGSLPTSNAISGLSSLSRSSPFTHSLLSNFSSGIFAAQSPLTNSAQQPQQTQTQPQSSVNQLFNSASPSSASFHNDMLLLSKLHNSHLSSSTSPAPNHLNHSLSALNPSQLHSHLDQFNQSQLGGLSLPPSHSQTATSPPSSQPRFDMSEFPSLNESIESARIRDASANSQSGMIGPSPSSSYAAASAAASAGHQSLVSPVNSNSDFAMTAEEFPALSVAAQANARRNTSALAAIGRASSNGAVGTPSSTPSQTPSFPSSNTNIPSRPSSTTPIQSPSPSSTPPPRKSGADRYGLNGLLSVIRMTDPALNTLALGTDLTTLGLNLNSTEVLYATFAYPCAAGSPVRRSTDQADYVLPFCIAKGSQVSLSCGVSVNIETLTETCRILALNTHETVPTLTNALQVRSTHNGMRPCIELTLCDGRQLTCTADHQIACVVHNEVRFIAAEDITADMSVVVGVDCPEVDIQCARIDENERRRLNDWSAHTEMRSFHCTNVPQRLAAMSLARVLGYVLGAGIALINGAHFIAMNNLMDAEAIADDLRVLTGKPASITYKNAQHFCHVPSELVSLIQSLTSWTFTKEGSLPATRSLPVCMSLNTTPDLIVREFIGGVFGSRGQRLRIVNNDISTVSLTLDDAATVKELQRMMNRFDVSADVRTIIRSFELVIDVNSTMGFHRRIGFRYAVHKAMTLSAAASYLRAKASFEESRSATEYMQSINALHYFASFKPESDESLPPPMLTLGVRERRSADECEVLDLSVSDVHNFLVNGCCVHNCYYMQPPALKTSHLAKFTIETLFYIFYAMPKDTLQVYAAKELYNREWRYHKELKLWFTRATNGAINDATAGNTTGNGGGSGIIGGGIGSGVGGGNIDGVTYVYFDMNTWERRFFRETHLLAPHKFMTEEELQQL